MADWWVYNEDLTGDLKDTILKKISIDEYEPKTGEAKDVVVLGFYLNENTPGQDLYNFISNSIYEIRDAEVPLSNREKTIIWFLLRWTETKKY